MRLKNTLLILSVVLLCFSCRNGRKTTASQTPPSPVRTAEDSLLEVSMAQEKAKAEAIVADSLVASIERTACMGMCPAYTIKFYRGGYVTYSGSVAVENIGDYYAVMDPKVIGSILKEAEKIGYFSLKDEYSDPYVVDFPFTITYVNSGVKKKKIVNGNNETPSELKAFELFMDGIVKDVKWTAFQNRN